MIEKKESKVTDKKDTPKIIVDGKEYLIEDLSDNAKQQLGSLRATDAEIIRLEAMVAMLKTARIGYARAAKEELAD